jgi:hypothetical protein
VDQPGWTSAALPRRIQDDLVVIMPEECHSKHPSMEAGNAPPPDDKHGEKATTSARSQVRAASHGGQSPFRAYEVIERRSI